MKEKQKIINKAKFALMDVDYICGECTFYSRVVEFGENYIPYCRKHKTTDITYFTEACQHFKPERLS
jgi:hypothetical protein